MSDIKIPKSNDDNLHRRDSGSNGGGQFTRNTFKARESRESREFENLHQKTDGETESTTSSMEETGHRGSSYQDYLRKQRKLTQDVKADGFDLTSIGQSDDLNARRPTTQGLKHWLETTERCVPSQTETSDLNQLLEALNQHMNSGLLGPKAQAAFSERFKSAYAKVDFASRILSIWEAANDLAKRNQTKASDNQLTNDLAKRNQTKASDNQLADNLTNATNKLNEALDGLEPLKQDMILDKRIHDIKGRYRKAANMAHSLDHKEGAITLRRTYSKLSSQFQALREKVQENGSSTYADCHSHLDRMEAKFQSLVYGMNDILHEKVLERYPVARYQVSQAMRPVITKANWIHDQQKSVGNPNSRYSPKMREARFKQVEREFVRRFLTGDFTDANDLLQDRDQLALEVDPVYKRCEKVTQVETQIRTSLEYMKPILEHLTQSGKPAHRFDQKWYDTFMNKRRVALLIGSIGRNEQKLKELEQMASDILQAKECCEKVTKVETQFDISLEYMKPILERLTQSRMPANRFGQEWIDTFRGKRPLALREGAQGTNGRFYQGIERMTSDILQASECCKKVSVVETQVRSDVDSIRSILKKHKLNDILKVLDSIFGNQRQYELGNTAQREGVHGTNGQAFDNLQQFASDVRKVKERCEAVDVMVSQLKKSSNGAEGHNLQQEGSNPWSEAIEGRYDGLAFKVLEQNFEEEMQKRFNSYKFTENTYRVPGQLRPDSSDQGWVTSIFNYFIEIYQPNQLNKLFNRSTDIDLRNQLNKLFEQFTELRENAQKKSGSERTKDNLTLMETLSTIENLTQKLEQSIEKQIDSRFDDSRDVVVATANVASTSRTLSSDIRLQMIIHPPSTWELLSPLEFRRKENRKSLIKKHEEASNHFLEERRKFRSMSGSPRAKGNILLVDVLSQIEGLEKEIRKKTTASENVHIHQEFLEIQQKRRYMNELRNEWRALRNP